MADRLRAWKLGVGAALALLSLGTLGGLLFLALLDVANDANATGARVVVVVERADGPFEVEVTAATPLDALEIAGRAAGFEVARTGDGASLAAADGRANGAGGRWSYQVAREGETLAEPGPEGTFELREGDRVSWTYR